MTMQAKHSLESMLLGRLAEETWAVASIRQLLKYRYWGWEKTFRCEEFKATETPTLRLFDVEGEI